jgi:hypothetical protein
MMKNTETCYECSAWREEKKVRTKELRFVLQLSEDWSLVSILSYNQARGEASQNSTEMNSHIVIMI